MECGDVSHRFGAPRSGGGDPLYVFSQIGQESDIKVLDPQENVT